MKRWVVVAGLEVEAADAEEAKRLFLAQQQVWSEHILAHEKREPEQGFGIDFGDDEDDTL